MKPEIEITIDGIKYIATPVSTSVNTYYMHDNCTFSKLTGCLDDVLQQAAEWGKKSPHGMLCDAVVMQGKKEIRRVGICVHASRDGFAAEDLHTPLGVAVRRR